MGHKCGRFAETLISGYLDGVLDPSDRRGVELHLRRCAICRHLLADLRRIRTTMMASCRQDFPVELLVRSL